MKKQSKITIRRSTAEELLFGCELAGMLALSGAKSKGNSNTEKGTIEHNKIKEALLNGIIPDNIKFAMEGINPADCKIEEKLFFETDKIILTCEPDLYLIKGKRAIIYDWKFTDESDYVTGGYEFKTFQPFFYEYVLFMLYPELKEILFQYKLPNTQDTKEPKGYELVFRDYIIEKFEKDILPKLEKYIDFDVNNAYPDFSKCNSCFYKADCRFMKPELLEKKSELILKESFEITQQNVGDVYNFCNQIQSKCKDIKDSIKKRMIDGELGTFNISDSKCIELVNKKGNSTLNVDLLNEFLKFHNKSYDDFCDAGKPTKSLQQKKFKS